MMQIKTRKPWIIAHCGNQEQAPENTLSSFQQAIKLEADGIEFDVLETKDSHLVVHHDYELGRTNNGKGFVSENTLKQVRSLDAGSWFDPKFKEELIPTFEEVVNLCKGKCRMEIELKQPSEKFINKCLDLLIKKKVLADVEITSPHITLLLHIKKKNSKVRIGMFIDIYPDWMSKKLGRKLIIDNLILAGFDVAHIPFSILDQELVDKLHKNNKLVHAANCNTQKDIMKAIKLGADQLSTNKIELALKIRNNKQV